MNGARAARKTLFVIRPEGDAVRLEVTLDAATTPDVLRALVREHLGVDAVLLHDGGLSLGVSSTSVLMEALERVAGRGEAWHLPPNVRPWHRPGWFAEVVGWLEQKLTERGERLTGEVEQVHLNDLVCVLRADTDKGGVYFKASETPFEAAVTAYLAGAHPALTPEILAQSPVGWLVTRDGGARLSTSAGLRAWSDALTKLARFHYSGNAAALETLGCPVHPFDDLMERFNEFLRDRDALAAWGLTELQVAGLEHLLPTLQQTHNRVRALDLRETPIHGDAQPMNALSRGARWFDWSETGVAHPFMDIGWCLAWVLNPARNALPVQQHEGAFTQLWRNYLEALGVSGADILMEDSMRLALAHRALIYHQKYVAFRGTVPGWRPQYVPYYLRLLLKLSRV